MDEVEQEQQLTQGVNVPISSTRDNTIRLEEDIDELEWHRIISTPHVRSGIRRLAAEARRQIAAGEFEEGGFAVE